jgi:hypothetical protein
MQENQRTGEKNIEEDWTKIRYDTEKARRGEGKGKSRAPGWSIF